LTLSDKIPTFYPVNYGWILLRNGFVLPIRLHCEKERIIALNDRV